MTRPRLKIQVSTPRLRLLIGLVGNCAGGEMCLLPESTVTCLPSFPRANRHGRPRSPGNRQGSVTDDENASICHRCDRRFNVARTLDANANQFEVVVNATNYGVRHDWLDFDGECRLDYRRERIFVAFAVWPARTVLMVQTARWIDRNAAIGELRFCGSARLGGVVGTAWQFGVGRRTRDHNRGGHAATLLISSIPQLQSGIRSNRLPHRDTWMGTAFVPPVVMPQIFGRLRADAGCDTIFGTRIGDLRTGRGLSVDPVDQCCRDFGKLHDSLGPHRDI